MKTALVITTMLFAVSPAGANDALERLRNASANELCWDTARGFARERYPTVKVGEPLLTQASFSGPAPSPVKESRKAFPGIRTC
jgi:hypothetical protein